MDQSIQQQKQNLLEEKRKSLELFQRIVKRLKFEIEEIEYQLKHGT